MNQAIATILPIIVNNVNQIIEEQKKNKMETKISLILLYCINNRNKLKLFQFLGFY